MHGHFPPILHESASHSKGYEHAPHIVGEEGRVRQRLQPCLGLPEGGGVAPLNRSEAKALLDTLALGDPLSPRYARGTGWSAPRFLTRAAL
jgi:hypothetical protein